MALASIEGSNTDDRRLSIILPYTSHDFASFQSSDIDSTQWRIPYYGSLFLLFLFLFLFLFLHCFYIYFSSFFCFFPLSEQCTFQGLSWPLFTLDLYPPLSSPAPAPAPASVPVPSPACSSSLLSASSWFWLPLLTSRTRVIRVNVPAGLRTVVFAADLNLLT